MKFMRKQHSRTKEELKAVLTAAAQQHGFHTALQWDGFAFYAHKLGTTVRGFIFDNELHVEIFGLLEHKAEQRVHAEWKDLVNRGLV